MLPNGTYPAGGGQDVVRQKVKELLEASPAFQALPADRRRAIAQQTVEVASYLAQPDGIPGHLLPTAAAAGDPYALAQAGPPRARGGAQEDPKFTAQAAREGAAAAGLFLQQINFADFVGGLIKNVFQAIVTSSIEQMEAYGKLVADVSKSLNQFRDENVSPNQGRDHLVEQFPDTFMLDMDTGGEGTGPRVRLRDGVDERQALQRINQSLPLDGAPLTSLDDDMVEEKLVPAARTQLATSRQQLLATMVLMGINRIVVTDGKIQAKVLFDFQAKDNFRFQKSATQFDYHDTLRKDSVDSAHESQREGGTYSRKGEGADLQVERSGGSFYSKGHYKYNSEPMLTMASASQLQNDASLSTKAQLMGNVEVNFKSDYLPLEKMADSFQISRIQDASRPGQAAPRGAGAAPAPAQPAPAPTV
jgi:hypothetical protein